MKDGFLNKKISILTFSFVLLIIGLFFAFLIISKGKEIIEIKYGAPYYFETIK